MSSPLNCGWFSSVNLPALMLCILTASTTLAIADEQQEEILAELATNCDQALQKHPDLPKDYGYNYLATSRGFEGEDAAYISGNIMNDAENQVLHEYICHYKVENKEWVLKDLQLCKGRCSNDY